MANFQLSCESTVDLPYSYVAGRNIPVLFYSYTVNDQVYEDDMGRDPNALPQFYQFIAEGKLPSTSQINTYRYVEFFRSLLEQGDAPLSESLALFSEGSKLLSACQKELDTARQKVVKLTKGPDGAPVEDDFTSEEDYI